MRHRRIPKLYLTDMLPKSKKENTKNLGPIYRRKRKVEISSNNSCSYHIPQKHKKAAASLINIYNLSYFQKPKAKRYGLHEWFKE